MSKGLNPKKAWLKGKDFFPRWIVEGPGIPLANERIKPDVELLVAERGGERTGFIMRELSHPHMAQGKLAGIPYLVAF